MIIFGITGGIGSGKSVVTRLMGMLGVPVYIADLESKLLLDNCPALKTALQQEFGEAIYNRDRMDRAAFASIIFNDSERLKVANRIIHPFVKAHFFDWVEKQRVSGKQLVAKEAAILYESGFDKFVDKVILVYAPLECRLERAMQRDKATREQIQARIGNQMPDEEKLLLADYVIDNGGSRSVIQQVVSLLHENLIP